ncbi:MAG: ComEC/Rec2 family competence protein, partial [Candidatus Omnitrophota bacterium]
CFCVSFSAWLGTAPLIAHTFGNFSSISVLANIVVVPLAMLVMTTGFALVAVGSFFPFFAMPLGHANEFFMFLLIKINFLLERLPFAFLNFPPIPLLFVIGYYILLFLLVTTLERSEASLTRLG